MIIYLDNAATSYPKPAQVWKSVRKSIKFYGNPGRSAHELAMESANQVFRCRNDLCDFFDYDAPENIVFTLNATYAINIAIQALYQEGCHVLISDLEHNAVYRPIHHLSTSGKITYSIFSHKGEIIENIRKLTQKNTKMLVCTHASNVTGERMPIKEIGEYCKTNKICFIIDASQSAGHFPISLREIHFDAFCVPAHNGLLGIQGCGFAIIKGACQRDFILGGTGNQSFLPHMPLSMPDRYEAGTLPIPAICALRSGIEYLKNHSESLQHLEEKNKRLWNDLSNIKEIHLISPPNSTGIISFTCQEQENFAQYLTEKHVCIRSGFHCAPLAHQSLGTEENGCIRISLGIFNTEADINNFLLLVQRFWHFNRI